MTEIIQLNGTEKRLYTLVAPLVMNPDVLKQNNNYPFRTSKDFVWFIAVEKRQVTGFIPVEHRKREHVINNYYIAQNRAETLKRLLDKIIETTEENTELIAVAFAEDTTCFEEAGFEKEKVWTRYVKLRKTA